MKETFLPKYQEAVDYEQCFPQKLLSRTELEKSKPNREWAKYFGIDDPNLAQRGRHGFGHIARIMIYESLLTPKLEEKGFIISNAKKAALHLSAATHDFAYEGDYEAIILLKRHQVRSSKRTWLRHVFYDMKKNDVDLFQKVYQEDVVNLASRINRVHDFKNSNSALELLQKEYDPELQHLPLELRIFKDLDSGLEALRLEELYKRIKPFGAKILSRILRQGTLNPKAEKSVLHWLYFPHFEEEINRLLPFAVQLYRQSTENPEFKIDQWKTTLDTAKALGAIK